MRRAYKVLVHRGGPTLGGPDDEDAGSQAAGQAQKRARLLDVVRADGTLVRRRAATAAVGCSSLRAYDDAE